MLLVSKDCEIFDPVQISINGSFTVIANPHVLLD